MLSRPCEETQLNTLYDVTEVNCSTKMLVNYCLISYFSRGTGSIKVTELTEKNNIGTRDFKISHD